MSGVVTANRDLVRDVMTGVIIITPFESEENNSWLSLPQKRHVTSASLHGGKTVSKEAHYPRDRMLKESEYQLHVPVHLVLCDDFLFAFST